MLNRVAEQTYNALFTVQQMRDIARVSSPRIWAIFLKSAKQNFFAEYLLSNNKQTTGHSAHFLHVSLAGNQLSIVFSY